MKLFLVSLCLASASLGDARTFGGIGDIQQVLDRLGDEILTHRSLGSASAAYASNDGVHDIADDINDHDDEMPEEFDDIPHPECVHNWGSHLDAVVGQVSGVAVNPQDQPVIFHRGNRKWDENTFTAQFTLSDRSAIPNATLMVLDPETAEVQQSWGEGMFRVPHGVTVDAAGNVYVTDVGLHQVMRFPANDLKTPDLILGEAFMPGSDGSHFCQPTSVAVSDATGDIFVGDGYCNSRVIKFDKHGRLLNIINGNWRVVHSLALFENEDVLCLADREGQRIDCVRAGLQSGSSSRPGEPSGNGLMRDANASDETGEHVVTYTGVGRTYALAAKGSSLLAASGSPDSRGITIDTAAEKPQILDVWGIGELTQPHAMAISNLGDAVYVAEIGKDVQNVHKFEVVRKGDFP